MALVVDGAVILVEEVEFELRRRIGGVAHGGEPLELAP